MVSKEFFILFSKFNCSHLTIHSDCKHNESLLMMLNISFICLRTHATCGLPVERPFFQSDLNSSKSYTVFYAKKISQNRHKTPKSKSSNTNIWAKTTMAKVSNESRAKAKHFSLFSLRNDRKWINYVYVSSALRFVICMQLGCLALYYNQLDWKCSSFTLRWMR